MRYLSLFSGIEAATVAWHGIGWTPVAYAEIDAFPCDALAARFPHVPNLGDVSAITDEQIAALGPIDVVIGGSPCQDLSVAGKRAGLDGARSSLFHEQVRIFHAARTLCGARWCVWENVPGAFSSNCGRDFAAVVGTLAGCGINVPREGWGCEGVALGPHGLVEWGMLDAQWFGLAQRRDRVFAVLDSGNWADRPPVLLEPESVRGDSPPRRASGQGIAGSIVARTARNGGASNQDVDGGMLAVVDCGPGGDDLSHALSGRDSKGPCSNLAHATLVAIFDERNVTCPDNRSNPQPGDPCHTLHDPALSIIVGRGAVRRLTPRECERLQGFPDDWTLIDRKGKPAADGPRYKALGNSMAVPVITWIGRRIERAHRWAE